MRSVLGMVCGSCRGSGGLSVTVSCPERRRFIAGSVSLAALLIGGAIRAEEGRLSGAISRAKDGLSGLIGGVLGGLFRRYDQAREFLLRRDVLEAAREAPPADVERNIADDVRAYLDLFKRFGVSLIPGTEEAPLAAAPPVARPDERIVEVIADIVIETLGLGDAHDMLLFLFENLRQTSGPLLQIEQAVRAGELRRAAGLMPALVRQLLADESQALLIRKFGEARTKTLIRGILVALAEYAVPFLGWGTLAVSFMITLWRNRTRLKNARV
jgi:hypothetical protein